MLKKCLLIGSAIAVLIAVALEAYKTERSPRTYREAVIGILDIHHIPYADVTIGSFCPHSVGCRGSTVGMIYVPWIAAVAIVGAHPAQGQMICIKPTTPTDWEHCTLSITALHMYMVPLPTLMRDAAWSVRVQRFWYRLEQWKPTEHSNRQRWQMLKERRYDPVVDA